MDDENPAPLGDDPTAEVGFQVEATRLPRGQTELTVRQDGALRHKDIINISREDSRQKFCKSVAKKLGVAPEQVDVQLLHVMQELEEAGGDDEAGEEAQVGSDAQVLVVLGGHADLFHCSDGKAYATVPVNGHAETFTLRSPSFRQWLAHTFRNLKNRPPSMDALSQALLALEAEAQLDGPNREVHLRVAAVVEGGDPDDPTIFIDLNDAERRAVRVDRYGWSVVTSPPVRFRGPRGMHALPVPQDGGSLAELRQFLNLPRKRHWLRFLAWLLKAFYPPGPDPILAVSGEQGSAKSSLGRVARLLIDPHEVVDRSLPKDIRDLMIAANGSAVLSFDNVSHLPAWFADAACRLSTGASFGTRELFSDADEAQFSAKRLVILNGIPDLLSQGDVLDRTMLLHLPTIPKGKRRTEKKFWADFHARRPMLLGALLDCLVATLQLLPGLPESGLPRMADFALFGEAVCRAAGEPAGAFAKAERSNRREAAEIVLDSSVVAGPILALVTEEAPVWEGEAQDLLNLLPALADPDGTGVGRGRHWPQSPRGMSGQLRRLAPALRVFGIDVEFYRSEDHERNRMITIRRACQAT